MRVERGVEEMRSFDQKRSRGLAPFERMKRP
jgi:hypothetical protein